MNKDVLYKVDSTSSLKDYQAMAIAFMSRSMFSAQLYPIILFLLISTYFIAEKGNNVMGIYFILGAIVYPFLFRYLYKRKLKKTYESNPVLQNLTTHFNFYEDHVEINNDYDPEQSIVYRDFYKIHVTNTHVYLMVSSKNTYYFRTNECDPGLISFLSGLPAAKEEPVCTGG